MTNTINASLTGDDMRSEIGLFFRGLVAYLTEPDDADAKWPAGVKAMSPSQRRASDPKTAKRFSRLSALGVKAKATKRKTTGYALLMKGAA